MRQIIVAVGIAVAACKGGGGGGGGSGGGSGGGAAFVASLPQVAAAEAVFVPTGPPPELVILVDAAGAVRIAEGPASWAVLGRDPGAGAKPADMEHLHKEIAEARSLGIAGRRVVREFENTELRLDPATRPDDATGGTGTAMTLDEGASKRPPPPAADAAAATHGALGWRDLEGLFGTDASAPAARQSSIVGAVIGDGTDEKVYAVVLADPAAKATAFIAVQRDAQLLAVGHAGAIKLLRLAFPYRRIRDGEPAPPWIEVRIWPFGLEIEAVPEVPSPVSHRRGAAYDAAAIATAYQDAMAKRTLNRDYPVDVLVSPETTVQELIDVVVALELAGATVIGLGQVPGKGDPEAQKRGHP